MKLTNTIKIGSIFFVLAFISSCASVANQDNEYTTPQQSHQLTDISHLTDEEKAELYEAIIAADLAVANGEYELATSYYLTAADLSKSIDLILLSLEAASNSNDTLATLQAAEMWLSIDPNDIDALVLKISSLLTHQEISQALELTDTLLLNQSDLVERFNLLNEIVINQQPGIVDAYFNQLSLKHPEAVEIHTGRASFFARVAKQTRNPAATINLAFNHLENALAIKADFIPAIELKTRLYYQSRQDEKAEALLRKLHAEYPKSAEISHLLGQLLYDLRKYDLSKQHYRSWLKNHKRDPEARFYLAASYFAANQYELSLKEYRKILGSNYKPQLVYFFCGNAASQIKQYSQAIACYELVEEGKYLTRSKIELAKIYALTGNTDKALATVRNPNFALDTDTQIQLINVEIDILDKHVSKQQASKRLHAALANHPDNVSLLFKKIKIDDLSDKPKQLVELLAKAEKQIPDVKKRQQFNLSVAGFLRNNNHYQQAVSWLNRALEESPDNKDYLYARALYKEPLGLYDEMINDFKHLLSLDPENVNIMNALGYTLVDVNQELDYASQLIEQAFLAMPDNAAVIDSKGWLAFRKGLYDQAIKYLTIAFKMAPSADVATHIGEVYWTSGDKTKAMKFWQQAKTMDPKNFLLLTTIKKLEVELGEK